MNPSLPLSIFKTKYSTLLFYITKEVLILVSYLLNKPRAQVGGKKEFMNVKGIRRDENNF